MTYIKSKRSQCLLLGSHGPSSLKNRDTDPQIPSKTFRRRFLALSLIYLPSAIKQMPTSRPPHSTSITRHSKSTTITQKSKKNDKPRAPQRNPTSSTIIDGNTRPFIPSCRWHVSLVGPCTRATCEGAEARIRPRPRRADEAYHGRGLPPGAFRVRHDTP